MRVFITGAGGFVGRALCDELLAAGHDVTALLLPDEDAAFPASVRIARGDITDPASLAGLLEGQEAVYHLAGKVGYGQDWKACRAVNVDGTRHVAAEAIAAGARRFVQMSSVSVYGRVPEVALTEDAPLRRIGEPYGDTKIEAEEVVRALAETGELDLTIVRPVVIYGPGDRLFLPKLVENVRSGQARVVGKGAHGVDLVYVGDVARFLVAMLEDPRAVGATLNLADPDACSWVELLAAVATELGVEPPRRHVPYAAALGIASLMEVAAKIRGVEPRLTRYAVKVVGRPYRYVSWRAAELGFRVSTPVSDGIAACVRSYERPPRPAHRVGL